MKKLFATLLILSALFNPTLVSALTTNTHSADLETSSTQFFSITDASQSGLDITGDISIALWVNPESLNAAGGNDYLVSKDAASHRAYDLYFTNPSGTLNKLHFIYCSAEVCDGASRTICDSSVDVNTGSWTHVVVTAAVATQAVKFYINGTLDASSSCSATAAGSIVNSTATFEVGGSAVDPSGQFDGLIDDTKIWGRVITGTEVSNFYSDPCNTANGASIVSQWLFDNNSNDAVGSNNLTNNNSTPFVTTVAYTCAAAGGGLTPDAIITQF